jgi:hypothetical protein
MEADVSSLQAQMQSGFTEIKLLLEQRNTHKTTQIVTAAATIITALIGLIGYIIVKT